MEHVGSPERPLASGPPVILQEGPSMLHVIPWGQAEPDWTWSRQSTVLFPLLA